MNWIHNFQLFLFDFDGLLVNTEEIHYQAYSRMLIKHGLKMPWSFTEYCYYAHYTSDGFQKALYTQFPQLTVQAIPWKELYADKTNALLDLYSEGAVHLMPGVEELLTVLQQAQIKHCVVTHSAQVLINSVRNQIEVIDNIPFWITREDYSMPKPNPECYLKAIELYADRYDHIIGFEDTPRGLAALRPSRALPVIVSSIPYPELDSFKEQGVLCIQSFEQLAGMTLV